MNPRAKIADKLIDIDIYRDAAKGTEPERTFYMLSDEHKSSLRACIRQALQDRVIDLYEDLDDDDCWRDYEKRYFLNSVITDPMDEVIQETNEILGTLMWKEVDVEAVLREYEPIQSWQKTTQSPASPALWRKIWSGSQSEMPFDIPGWDGWDHDMAEVSGPLWGKYLDEDDEDWDDDDEDDEDNDGQFGVGA